jgi:two-component system, NtrC family, response regulator AtoC
MEYVTAAQVTGDEGKIPGAVPRSRRFAVTPALQPPLARGSQPALALPGDTAMERVRRLVQCVARGTISVLLLGETGVGKERMAEAIHRASGRADKPFLCLNCAALSESLLESELFGHEKGAFTSALGAKPGLLETADGGTVLLDEVGELSPTLQVKLLRVLEDHKVMRVGSTRPREIDVRFVSATNRDLRAEIACRRFREDLFFRLNGACVRIPSLRERRTEIRSLARELLAACGAKHRSAGAPQISEAALALLEGHSWPGNIRELRNVIERASLVCEGATIEPCDLDLELETPVIAGPCPERRDDPAVSPADLEAPLGEERAQIVRVLAQTAGNQTQAARLLGVSRATLVRRLDEYGLPRPRQSGR